MSRFFAALTLLFQLLVLAPSSSADSKALFLSRKTGLSGATSTPKSPRRGKALATTGTTQKSGNPRAARTRKIPKMRIEPRLRLAAWGLG